MKRLSRYLFYVVVTLLWITAACAGLELYARLRWRSIEEDNPYVRAALGRSGVPGLPDLNDHGEAPIIPDPSLEPPPPPVPSDFSDADDHLGTRLAALPEEDRAVYATLRDLFVVVYDHTGRFIATYGSDAVLESLGMQRSDLNGRPFGETPFGLVAPEGVGMLDRVVTLGKSEVLTLELHQSGQVTNLEVSAYPSRVDAVAEVLVACSLRNVTGLPLSEMQARLQQTDAHPMWKEPFFEYRKHARVSPHWWTNNVGFRDDDVILPRPHGVFRIACVGGSTTEEGYTNGTTYPNQLEKRLQTAFSSASIEVINCGVVGLDSLGEKRRALDFALLEPNLVIHYNAVNDICHALMPMWEQEAERFWPAWRLNLRKSEFLRRYGNGIFWPSEQAIRAQMEQSTIQHLRVLHEVLKERGVDLALCSFSAPDLEILDRKERDFFEWNTRRDWQGRYFTFGTYRRMVDIYNEMVKSLCQELGLQYLALDEDIEGDTTIFGDICHMRPKGISQKAEVLAEQLGPYLDGQLAKARTPQP